MNTADREWLKKLFLLDVVYSRVSRIAVKFALKVNYTLKKLSILSKFELLLWGYAPVRSSNA